METYTRYWVASMARGVVAIVAGLAVLVLPEMISLVFVIPFAIFLSMLCLAAYGLMDSVIVFTTSFLLPHHESGRLALRVQGALGAITSALLFFLVYDHSQLKWFLYLAAAQAAATALTEFTVARKTSLHHGSAWCYISASVAALSAVVLLFGLSLEPQRIAWLLFAYLGLFGFTLSILSARMLFAERGARHPIVLHDAVLAGAR